MMPQEADLPPQSPEPTSNDLWPWRWPQTAVEFERLVEVFQHRLVWNAFRRLGDRQEAEDAVQDVLLRVFAERGRLAATVRQVRPYLYRMVANACSDRLRHQARRRNIVAIDTAGLERIADRRPDAAEQAAASQALERVNGILGRLPRRQAEVIRLRVLDELPLAEAAQIVGCTLATAKSRLRYGLQKLRRIMAGRREERR